MNDTQIQKSEVIASKIIRVLAIIGMISVLALATWAIVQGLRKLPGVDGNLSAVISSMRGALESAPEETLSFTLNTKTIASGESEYVEWTYKGGSQPGSYTFSYTCGTETVLSIMENTGWSDLACDTPFETTDSKIKVIPTNSSARFADVQIEVLAGELKDTTVITVVNTDVANSPSNVSTTEEAGESTTNSDTAEQEMSSSNNTTTSSTATTQAAPTQQPVYTQPQQTTIVTASIPAYTGPADLVVNIEETGVVMKVSGEDTFFPISPIPSNKVAAVRFTVTNEGGETSEPWTFKAELPLNSDKSYDYTSPLQAPILSGMQVEYTLSFDEVLEDDRGTIRIKIYPEDSSDSKTNNEDSIIVKIDER